MAKTIREQRERQKKLIILLVVLLGAMGVALYFGLGLGGDSSPAPASSFDVSSGGPLTSSVSENQITSVSLDLDVLEKEAFTSLRIFGDLPIILGEIGRLNPFVTPAGSAPPAAQE